MRIHLIRHGQTNWNQEKRVQGHSESTLTQQGREQAAALRTSLAAFAIGKVYCSSSIRTRETATILFGEQVETEFSDALREIHLGPWEGSLQAELQEKYPQSFGDFWHRPHAFALEGAESFLQVQRRGVQEFLRIVAQAGGDDVAIVSHGVLIKSILCHLEARPLERLWEPPVMHNCAHSIVRVGATGDGSVDRHLQIVQYAGILQEGFEPTGLLTAKTLIQQQG